VEVSGNCVLLEKWCGAMVLFYFIAVVNCWQEDLFWLLAELREHPLGGMCVENVLVAV
jgi:hypothetical protein